MSPKLRPALVLSFAALALAGCEDLTGPTYTTIVPAVPEPAPASQPQSTTTSNTGQASLPAVEGLSVEDVEVGEEVGTPITLTGPGEQVAATPQIAESNCLMAVAAESGATQVSPINMASNESGTTVMVRVPEAETPWKCTTNLQGAIVDVAQAE